MEKVIFSLIALMTALKCGYRHIDTAHADGLLGHPWCLES